MGRYEALENVLAFLGALRDYSYIDRLSNSLDEISAVEALRDAIRSYISLCVDSEDKCVKISGRNEKLKCPDLDFENLKADISNFKRTIESRSRGGQANIIEIVREARSISLEALALIPTMRTNLCSQEGGGKG